MCNLFFLGCMTKLDKRILESQINVFLNLGIENQFASPGYRQWLDLFMRWTDKESVSQMSYEDMDLFIQECQDINTEYQRISAQRALTAFLKYYMARSKNGRVRLTKGRPPHLSKIAEVKKYRKMRDEKGNPLSIRAISKIVGKNISLVHRWINTDTTGKE